MGAHRHSNEPGQQSTRLAPGQKGRSVATEHQTVQTRYARGRLVHSLGVSASSF
jgi:hypothetical protein